MRCLRILEGSLTATAVSLHYTFCGSHSFPFSWGTALSCGSTWLWGGLTSPYQDQGAKETWAETGGSSQRGTQEGLNGFRETKLMKMASIQFDEVSE